MAKEAYERFTGPARLDRDVHMLEGLIQGIAIDRQVNAKEASAILRWCDEHQTAAGKSPFNELLPKLRTAIADGVLPDEEREDLLWFCRQVRTPSSYYSIASSDLQRLHGILIGIAADKNINEKELGGVRDWLQSVKHLRGTWPYDEIDSLIEGTLSDGTIDPDEHRILLHFCQEFLGETPFLLLEAPFNEELIRFGVCSSCPEIVFRDHLFCFTGASQFAQREQLELTISALGGRPVPRVVKDLDYLIVGAKGNQSWAFSCYGRKVEATMELRKAGSKITIAHESDFWEAAKKAGSNPPFTTAP